MPALRLGSREIAHRQAPGRIDLRITGPAWRTLRPQWAGDAAIVAGPGRRDWIELTLTSAADVARILPLIEAAIAANG